VDDLVRAEVAGVADRADRAAAVAAEVRADRVNVIRKTKMEWAKRAVDRAAVWVAPVVDPGAVAAAAVVGAAAAAAAAARAAAAVAVARAAAQVVRADPAADAPAIADHSAVQQ
jgi:hypothetical protein